jgi:hypothetical protein
VVDGVEKLHDEINARLRAKGVSAACPSCGENRWDAFGDDVAIIQLAHIDQTVATGGFDVLPFFCAYCGYVRMHAIQALREEMTPE